MATARSRVSRTDRCGPGGDLLSAVAVGDAGLVMSLVHTTQSNGTITPGERI